MPIQLHSVATNKWKQKCFKLILHTSFCCGSRIVPWACLWNKKNWTNLKKKSWSLNVSQALIAFCRGRAKIGRSEWENLCLLTNNNEKQNWDLSRGKIEWMPKLKKWFRSHARNFISKQKDLFSNYERIDEKVYTKSFCEE